MEQLLNEAVESYNAYLVKLPEGCEAITQLLREEKIEYGLNNIANFAEGVMWMMEVTELLKKNNIDVQFNVEQAQHFLLEINEAMEVQDYNLLADLFEYELIAFFSSMKPIMES